MKTLNSNTAGITDINLSNTLLKNIFKNKQKESEISK